MFSNDVWSSSVAGVLVAFDETIELSEKIVLLAASIDHLVVVDNVPSYHRELASLSMPSNCRYLHNGNEGLLAGAYNRALAAIDMDWPETTHVLFLDDDTDVTTLSAFLRSPPTIEAVKDEVVAAVAPIFRDRDTGLRGNHLLLVGYGYRVIGRDIAVPTTVSMVINSMSLWRLEAMRKVGAFSTTLGLDHIDTDYCLRAQQAGYRITLNPTVEFLHRMGKQRRPYRFLGRVLQSTGHSAFRHYVISRNAIWLMKRYAFPFPGMAAVLLMRIGYEIVGILKVEDDKPQKVWAVLRGVWSGLFGRMGRPAIFPSRESVP